MFISAPAWRRGLRGRSTHTKLRGKGSPATLTHPAPRPTSSSRNRCRSSWQVPGSMLPSPPSPGLRFPGLPGGWSMASDIGPWEHVREGPAALVPREEGSRGRGQRPNLSVFSEVTL